ncbi:MAG: tape measure protein [Acidobacteria bacterium]|nr:tape measure protein [Acidobacteriota bacterium]
MADEAGSAQVAFVPTFSGLRSKVDSEVDAAASSSSSKFTTTFGNGIKGLGAFIGKSLAVAGGLAATVAAIAIKGGISRQLQIEDATAKLDGLGNSAATVKGIMNNALASVKGTAFGMGEAATVAAGATAAGIKPGKELERVLKLTADAATIAGTDMGTMGSIFNKVASSGKVTGDVVNQLSDRGVPILQMIAKQYGVTAEQASKMVSKGQVDFAHFADAMETNLGGAALKSGNVTKGAWANMLASMSRFGVVLSGGVFPLIKDVFNQITIIFDGLGTRLSPFADKFSTAFQGKAQPAIAGFAAFVLAKVDTIIGGIRAFAAAWKYNDGDITSSGFAGFMERAAFAIHQVVDAASKLDFSSFSGFVQSISGSGSAVSGALGSIGTSLQTLWPAVKQFIAQLPNLGPAAAKVASAGVQVLTTALSFLADHVDTIIAWMPAVVAGFVAWKLASSALADSQLAVQAAQVAMAPVQLANNVLRVIAINLERENAIATGTRTAALNLGNISTVKSTAVMVAQRVALVAGAAATGIATAAQWLFNAAMTANPIGLVILAVVALIAIIVLLVANWSSVVGFLTTVWQGFVTWFQGIMAGFLAWWGGVWDGILQVFSTVWQLIQIVFSTAWEVIQTLIATALAIMIALFTGNFGAIGGIVVSAWQKITGFFAAGAQAVSDLLSGTWNAITATVSAVWNGIIAYIQGIPGRFIQGLIAIAGFGAQIGQWVGSMRDAAVGRFNDLIGWVGGVPNMILNAIGSLGGLLSNAGHQIMDGFLAGLQNAFKGVQDFVGGIGQWIADHKGPRAYDLGLLVPNGGWIMQSLETGLKGGLPGLKDTLSEVTATVRAGVAVPGSSVLGGSGAAGMVTTRATAPTMINIDKLYGADPEDLAEEIEKKKQRAIDLNGLQSVAAGV